MKYLHSTSTLAVYNLFGLVIIAVMKDVLSNELMKELLRETLSCYLTSPANFWNVVQNWPSISPASSDETAG